MLELLFPTCSDRAHILSDISPGHGLAHLILLCKSKRQHLPTCKVNNTAFWLCRICVFINPVHIAHIMPFVRSSRFRMILLKFRTDKKDNGGHCMSYRPDDLGLFWQTSKPPGKTTTHTGPFDLYRERRRYTSIYSGDNT